jgi:chromosome segregation ATPase
MLTKQRFTCFNQPFPFDPFKEKHRDSEAATASLAGELKQVKNEMSALEKLTTSRIDELNSALAVAEKEKTNAAAECQVLEQRLKASEAELAAVKEGVVQVNGLLESVRKADEEERKKLEGRLAEAAAGKAAVEKEVEPLRKKAEVLDLTKAAMLKCAESYGVS